MGHELCYFLFVLAFCKCKTDDLGGEERRIKVFGGDESILNQPSTLSNGMDVFLLELLLTFEH